MKRLTDISAADLLRALMSYEVEIGYPEDYDESSDSDRGCQLSEDPDSPLGEVCKGECSSSLKNCRTIVTYKDGDVYVFCKCKMRPE